MATPILDLTTDRTRPVIRIDSVPYELRTLSDLTLEMHESLERRGARFSVLLLQTMRRPEEQRELTVLLDELIRIALIAPDPIIEGLGELHRALVAKVFLQLLAPTLLRMRAIAVGGGVAALAGAKPLPGSNGSTAARPPSGPAKHRSARARRSS